ncbi:cob(I)yrinic acid a,c-diamide adenosyltransferase [Enterocloster lavalensis]|uniref:cob(I)yrinic acid a,c-diamide adenosyltransferase n=1 Tax=Enterocloster lavalensis TaxID=460384 RepID=UPI0023F3336D|nr:cob(I)yrinic acid a,c-diamide adenosyltransferase [Enterocloster lavalensis]
MNGLVHIYCGDGKGKTTAALGLALRAAGNGIPVVIARFLKNDGSGEVGILENVPGVYLFHCERQFGFTWTMSEEQKAEAGEYFTGLFERAWEMGCKTAREDVEGAGKADGCMAGENWGSDSVSDGSSRRDSGVCGTGASASGSPVSGSPVSGSPVSVSPASAPLTSAPCEIRALLVLDEIMAAVNSGFVANESLLAALDHRPDGLEVVLTGRGPSKELLSRADYVTEMRAVKHPYEKGVGARKGVEY